jgi:hypothetical protein
MAILGGMMEDSEGIQTQNRRKGEGDRRQVLDRRAGSATSAKMIDSLATLRELLNEARDRIRLLEKAIEGLRGASH